MKNLCNKINEDLKTILSPKRYKHTLGVVKSAKMLCIKYDENIEKAEVSALLHDIAKQFGKEMITEKVKKYNIEFDDTEKVSNQLKHSKIGMYMAKYEYDIQDENILNAIRYHTTGRENMSKLEKIICLADYIEENRSFEGVEKIRSLAEIDINYALYYALNQTMIHLANENELIHQDTLKARNFLLREYNKNFETTYLSHIKSILE